MLVALAHPDCSLLSLSVVQSHQANKADTGRQGDMEGEQVFAAQLSLHALKKCFTRRGETETEDDLSFDLCGSNITNDVL